MSARRSCDTCRARKVRCSGRQGKEERCSNCVARKEECHWSARKPRTRQSGRRQIGRDDPADFAGLATPESAVLTQQLAISGSPGQSGNEEEGNFGYPFKRQDNQVSSCNVAFFSTATLQALAANLGSNRVDQLIEGMRTAIQERLDDLGPFEFPKSSTTSVSIPLERAKKYVQGYFDFVHPLYPFLDRPAFEANISGPEGQEKLKRNVAWSALYHAVLSIGCQWTENTSYNSNKCPAWGIFSICLAALPRLLIGKLSLLQIQAVTAMAIFCSNANGMPLQDMLVGEATRLATEARLHQWPHQATDNSSAVNLFWVVYSIDRTIRFLDGKTSLVPEADISIQPIRVPQDLGHGQAFEYLLSLSRLYSQAYERLFCARARANPISVLRSAVDDIAGSLVSWVEALPEPLWPGKTDLTTSNLLCPVYVPVTVHMFYCNLKIAISRFALQIEGQRDQRLETFRLDMWKSSRDIFDSSRFLDLGACTPLCILGTIPIAALFVLFDAVVFNPDHAETPINLIFLDIAAGYFSRLEYASGGWFRGSFLGEFAAMAKSYVKEYKKNGKGATPAISGMISTLESGSGMTREGIVAVSHADVVEPSVPSSGLFGDFSSSLDYAVTDDTGIANPAFANLDVMNLFGGMDIDVLNDYPEFRP